MQDEALITTESQSLAVSDELRALEPPANNSPIESLGQAMYIELQEGRSIKEIAATYCKDEDVCRDMINAALDNNVNAAIHAQTLNRWIIETALLRQKAAAMFERTPDVEELIIEALTADGKVKPLKQQRSNRREKTEMLKLQGTLLIQGKILLKANTGEIAESDRGEKKEIREMLSAVVGEAFRIVTQEVKEEAREVGRLQAGQQQSDAIVISATAVEGDDEPL